MFSVIAEIYLLTKLCSESKSFCLPFSLHLHQHLISLYLGAGGEEIGTRAQGLLLARFSGDHFCQCSGDHQGCWGSDPGWVQVEQTLYCCVLSPVPKHLSVSCLFDVNRDRCEPVAHCDLDLHFLNKN